MATSNNKRIEETATTALKAALLRCPILDSYIDSKMLQIRVQQEERDRIAEHAAGRGESMTAFIKRAVRETMERDNAESGKE